MKRLVTLVLVLSLAANVNATMVLTVNNVSTPATTINPGNTIVIGVAWDGSGPGMAYLSFEPKSGIGQGLIFTLSDPRGPAYSVPAIEPGEYALAILSPGPPTAGTIFMVDLHCEGPGDAYANLWNDAGGTIIDSLTVHQIPEPATLLLLGIGAVLFRLRRKCGCR